MIKMSLSFNTFVKLGANPELSKLELSSILEEFSIEEIKFQEWKNYILLKLKKERQNKLIKSLDKSGSIIKTGFFKLEEKLSDLNKIEPKIIAYLKEIIQILPIQKSRKIKISLNIQASSSDIKTRINKMISEILYRRSSEFQFEIKIRSSKKKSVELSPYQFYKENYHRRGIEITCLVIKSKVFIGHLRWVTNPLKDIKQDEERPVRLFTHGTSIKLARTLVNLSKIKKGDILFDPFCGTGTILLEGLKQDLRVVGIDKDPKCVRASKANLNHFSMKHLSKERVKDKWTIYHLDSQELNKVLDMEIGGLVTEPYLGPFIKDLPPKEIALDTMSMLEKLYSRIIQRSVKFLKPDHRVVLIIPEYRYTKDYSVYPDFRTIADKCGLKIITESSFFNVKLPVQIGRKHNIINRKLVIYSK